MKLCPINFKSTIELDASRIKKNRFSQMNKVLELAEKNHDKAVLDVLKETLNDGKDDKYELVYYHSDPRYNSPAVNLYKNNSLIIKKSENSDHCELANKILRELAYFKLSEAQKNEMKTDFENVKQQLLEG